MSPESRPVLLASDPDTVLFGPGAEAHMAQALTEAGAERVLLVATAGWTQGIDRIGAALGARAAGRFVTDRPQVPGEVADAAVALARELDADWVLAHGGGTAIGVAKIVARESGASVAAVPTTYAGSERTDIWGLTRDGAKTTGRDAAVRPKLVVYDPLLTTGLPVALSQKSLLNAMAHSVDALYDAGASERTRASAADSLAPLLTGLRAISADPTDVAGRAEAQRGAWMASEALGGAAMALHHKLAHVLGGSFGTPHADTHAVLLPHTMGFNLPAAPAALAALRTGLGADDPAAFVYDRMRDLGLPVALKDLGLSRDDLPKVADLVLQKTYSNPRDYDRDALLAFLDDAWHGRRPSLGAGRLPLPGAAGVHAGLALATRGTALEQAEVAVLALHGRGANADRYLADLEKGLGPVRGVALVAPQAAANTWYPKGFLQPVAENQPAMDDALATIDAAFASLAEQVGAANVVVAGFSQGACLALTWLQTTAHRPRQVVAMTGAHTPLPERDFSAARGARVRVSLSKGDKWVPQEAFDATVAALEAAGADVTATTPLATGHRIHREDLDHLQAALAETLGETNLRSLPGFGNAHQAEALPGALPRRGNTPRQAKYRLVTEQINGTGFTVKRAENHRVWMYRLRPWILDRPWKRREGGRFVGDFSAGVPTPQVMRFRPLTMPSAPTDFLAGLTTFAGAGDPAMRKGMAVHLYAANADMVDTAFANIDGDLLVVPEKGRLHVRTELGRLHVSPGELLVLPRGIRFQVLLPDGAARGWVAELMDGHFQLPERGPVGANGMADERHFLAPKPDFEDVTAPWTLLAKQGGQLWEQPADHSPFDVVAWHGSYAPFKYDLRNFGSLGNVQFDHVDPSVLTVLTSPMDTHGRNAIDVGVFLGRWDVTEGTFRPPYFHRNSAIEFNGVVANTTDEGPWAPGAFTFTPYLTPHGIAAKSYERVVTATDEQADKPVRMPDESIWVQFESTYLLKVMPWMLDHPDRDPDYLSSFSGYKPGPELP